MDDPASVNPYPFELIRREPATRLRGLVAHLMVYQEHFATLYRQREMASLVVPLVIGFGDAFRIGLGRRPRAGDSYVSFAAGLGDTHVDIESDGTCHCLQINFTPLGARLFFGAPLHELANAMVDPAALLGLPFMRLRERLGNEPDWHRRIYLAEAFVANKLADADGLTGTSASAFRLLAGGGRVRIADVAETVGWSRKHLNHVIRTEFGLGPKTVARIARFNKALALSAGDPTSWADIAYACGYSDQSHLVNEFRRFSGDTPGNISPRPSGPIGK